MGLSNNPHNYPDVAAILDEAIAHRGLRYTCETPSQALVFRMRAYHFRKLQQKLANENRDKGVVIPTKYDGLHIALAKGSATVVITFPEVKGMMTDLQGLPITPQTKKYETPADDEFVEVARELKDKLGLE